LIERWLQYHVLSKIQITLWDTGILAIVVEWQWNQIGQKNGGSTKLAVHHVVCSVQRAARTEPNINQAQ
jgi:hypothetical protein